MGLYTVHSGMTELIYHGSVKATRLGFSVTTPTASTWYALVPRELTKHLTNDGWIVSSSAFTAWTGVSTTHVLLEWKPA